MPESVKYCRQTGKSFLFFILEASVESEKYLPLERPFIMVSTDFGASTLVTIASDFVRPQANFFAMAESG